MFKSNASITYEDLYAKVSDADILEFYLGIHKIPILIKSPFRKDNHPSFSIYTWDCKKIMFVDHASKLRGGILDLFCHLWNMNVHQVINKIYSEMCVIKKADGTTKVRKSKYRPKEKISIERSSDVMIDVKVRDWKNYDIEYWESYGITKKWLQWAEVYPISHKIIYKDNNRYTFTCDKYAYCYIERKDGKIQKKIYQPFNDKYKWSTDIDKSVISLWTKVPEKGNILVICSSLKDALCLSCNTKIPAIALSAEGYEMSNTAIENLKSRYKDIYICLDSDETGIKDAEKLAEQTGFKNVVLPHFDNAKDISDIYKTRGKDFFLKTILPLFKKETL